MRKNSLQKDDRGASLLAVLILMVVISAIAVVITKITIVNIQMKEVERGTKKNFYSADAVMDDLRTGTRQKAEAALETAYVDVLQNYTNISRDGKNAQDSFLKLLDEKVKKPDVSKLYLLVSAYHKPDLLERMDSLKKAGCGVQMIVPYYDAFPYKAEREYIQGWEVILGA